MTKRHLFDAAHDTSAGSEEAHVSQTYRRKLIEVALPLEAINAASAREKSIRHGHPSTLHLWRARRPLAACRAVLFAQLVDDPSEYVGELLADPDRRRRAETELKKRLKEHAEKKRSAEDDTEQGTEPPTLDEVAADVERQRLFGVIEMLVPWKEPDNVDRNVLARSEIAQSIARGLGCPPPEGKAEVDAFLVEKAPPVVDPFCGGGSIPLEAQRLGLHARGSDLNPVAVLITKALVEFPPRFAGLPPVNAEARAKFGRGAAWNGEGAQGLAEDVRHYGQWMRDQAEKRIGHLYPKARLPDRSEPSVIAWLWARMYRWRVPSFYRPRRTRKPSWSRWWSEAITALL